MDTVVIIMLSIIVFPIIVAVLDNQNWTSILKEEKMK